MPGMITHVVNNECPCCGYVANRVGQLGSSRKPPEPGDATLCAGCGAICEFGPNLEMKLRTDLSGEWAELLPLQKKIRQMRGLPV